MNSDEKYRAWKERSRPLNIPADFAGDVMRRVCRQTEQRHKAQPNWPRLLELLQRSRSFQFAALAVAAIAGLSRFWLMFSIVLKP